MVLENPNWYTPYTPYQAEISQGRLESLLNYQTMVTELTGMDIANASLLDEATAAAEAVCMAYNQANGKKKQVFISKNLWQQTIDVIETRCDALGIEVVKDDPHTYDFASNQNICGAVVQNPDIYGRVHDFTGLAETLHKQKAILAVGADILSLVITKTPREMNADIAFGTTQRFGIPMGNGGPHAAYLACADDHKRKMPGRIIGVSIDVHGNRALRMSMQTREQHIRRDKATSNICTAQALLANMAAFYAMWHGKVGLQEQATRVHNLTQILQTSLQAQGYTLLTAENEIFDTLTIQTNEADKMLAHFAKNQINLRKNADGSVSLSLSEVTLIEDVVELDQLFAEFKGAKPQAQLKQAYKPYDSSKGRQNKDFMAQDVFNSMNSETQMMRYVQRLADKDVGLTKSMIPLGSCTMKLNSAIEMIPVTWSGFGNIHPFAPVEQLAGYQKMIKTLSEELMAITGYEVFSMQPNSGANGEFAGLYAIKKYHESRGEDHRNVCIIPISAHGTNPASAAMAGMKVVVVKCDSQGNIDIPDLKSKVEKHSKNLSALMITYPSTHGVFEEGV